MCAVVMCAVVMCVESVEVEIAGPGRPWEWQFCRTDRVVFCLSGAGRRDYLESILCPHSNRLRMSALDLGIWKSVSTRDVVAASRKQKIGGGLSC